MSLNLANRYRATNDVTEFNSEFWNGFVGELDLALNDILGKSASFDEARAELIQAALFRLNEILLPAYERVFEYQQAGFLTAPIAEDSEVEFVEGFTALAIHPDNRDLFRPTPFVALSRSSTSADVAIARADGYDAETGGLQVEIVAVIGAGGTFSDVIVSATAGSVQAQKEFLDDAKSARDRAADWAEKAVDVAVESGLFSAKHHATKAAASASAASGSASTATTAAAVSVAARDESLASAAAAAASAAAALTFDPAEYYNKGEADDLLGAKADDADIAPVGKSGSYGDLDNLPPLGAAAAIEKATTAQIYEAAGDTAVTANNLGDASALVSLTDATTVAVDWSGFVVGDVVLGGNRALGNPSAIIPGTTRYLFVRATSGTRTLTFGSNYKGAIPTINDVTSTRWYLLALIAYSSTHIVVSLMRAL